MRLDDAISLSTRMFKTRPMRTFLTILGVSIGIGAVLFLVSLGYGMQRLILSEITTEDSLLSLDVTSPSPDVVKIDKELIDKISKIEGVELVSPVFNTEGQFSIGEFTGDGIAHLIDSSYFRLSGEKPLQGYFFASDNNNEVVISSAGVQLFGLDSSEILNKKIDVSLFFNADDNENDLKEGVARQTNEYVIKGIIDDDSGNNLYLPISTVEKIKIDSYHLLKIKVTSDAYINSVSSQISSFGFVVSSLSETIDQANKIFKIIQIILAFFGFIALIVSSIGMFNTMTIALLERINEIGIMRAIGVTSRDIKIIFIMEAVLMGFLGGVGGIVVGTLLGEIANLGLNLLAVNFGGEALKVFYRPAWFLGFIVIFSTVIGLITGVYPSRKASKLNPLSALRYK